MNNPDVWGEAARQVPSLVVLVATVFWFLRFMSQLASYHTDRIEQLFERQRDTIERNTSLFEKVLERLAALS